MAVATLISEDEYLRTSYEHDSEWAGGEVTERTMPNSDHANGQMRLILAFGVALTASQAWGGPELRVRTHAQYRVVDFCLYRSRPDEKVPATPPLLVVEILSPDDRMSDVIARLREYADWGVPHVWLADPGTPAFYVWAGALQHVSAFTLPEYGITITPEQLFR